MLNRFEGNEGKRRMQDVLLNQKILCCNTELIDMVVEHGELVNFKENTSLILQDAEDNDVYFLLTGTVAIRVNGRRVATRTASDLVGEMSAIDVGTRRSATVVALEDLVALKLSEAKFHHMCRLFPEVWKKIALLLAERLRQRAQFHRTPNENPVVFIGSSSESLSVANDIANKIRRPSIDCHVWTSEKVFAPGGTTIDGLLAIAEQADFALFVFGPDDKVVSRGKRHLSPRDNVVLELGLFMGKIGRDRTLIIQNKSAKVKIPSDLLGVTTLTYLDHSHQDQSDSLELTCQTIINHIHLLKVR